MYFLPRWFGSQTGNFLRHNLLHVGRGEYSRRKKLVFKHFLFPMSENFFGWLKESIDKKNSFIFTVVFEACLYFLNLRHNVQLLLHVPYHSPIQKPTAHWSEAMQQSGSFCTGTDAEAWQKNLSKKKTRSQKVGKNTAEMSNLVDNFVCTDPPAPAHTFWRKKVFLKHYSKILWTIRVIRLGTCGNSHYLLTALEGNNVILSYSRRSREPIKKGRATLRVNMTKLPVDETFYKIAMLRSRNRPKGWFRLPAPPIDKLNFFVIYYLLVTC